MNEIKTDVLILGSGIAGLTLAIKIAEQKPAFKICIATKADKSESNTKYAQGGVAVVLDDNDTFNSHIEDTMVAGAFHNNRSIVEMVVTEAPDRLREIIKWGAEFDLNQEGEFDLGKEGGHSANRIVHHKDITGYEIERALLKKIEEAPNIFVYQHHFAIDLITDHHVKGTKPKLGDEINCYGAYILDSSTSEINIFASKFTVIATGGAGQVYSHTTNPLIATGDGIALAYRAKGYLCDLEFIQFHPTALYDPGKSPAFLISEAVRGFGAYLRDHTGKRFMLKYDDRAELASRDIVSRSIDNELKISGEPCVYLDCTHLDMEKFKAHFPNITEMCLSKGIDVAKDYIPVVPAAHYMCGGITVDSDGLTSMNRVYACGECSRTGLHGANRLASNSLLEALVYAHNIAHHICEQEISSFNPVIPAWNTEGTTEPEELVLISHYRKEVQALMSDLVAIVRTDKRLAIALKKLDVIYLDTKELYATTTLSPQLCELRNLVTVAYMILSLSMKRTENMGAFYKNNEPNLIY